MIAMQAPLADGTFAYLRTGESTATLALTGDGKAVREKIVAHFRTPPPQLLTLPVHELRALRCLLKKCADNDVPTPDEVTP